MLLLCSLFSLVYLRTFARDISIQHDGSYGQTLPFKFQNFCAQVQVK